MAQLHQVGLLAKLPSAPFSVRRAPSRRQVLRPLPEPQDALNRQGTDSHDELLWQGTQTLGIRHREWQRGDGLLKKAAAGAAPSSLARRPH
jgi:hypothetical protein